ncbi:MAG: lmo0937 family membrane protein [Cyclobacteriaceae bacterium]|nr:lmo0937 family membrane protein [Cyclobacteriaceae bacterium]
MNGLVYFITITLILAWLIGFYILKAGDLVHILLVMAIGLVVFKFYEEEQIY